MLFRRWISLSRKRNIQPNEKKENSRFVVKTGLNPDKGRSTQLPFKVFIYNKQDQKIQVRDVENIFNPAYHSIFYVQTSIGKHGSSHFTAIIL
jgi:hypothetical protein